MDNKPIQVEQPKVEVLSLSNAESLAALNRSEIDVQIATAKQYPRNLAQALKNMETWATMDEDTAGSCFYSLRREGKVIEGPSVRMAEIIAAAWGNLRVQARVIANDGKKITAQGICHDLESNLAASSEVSRRITGRDGRTYSDDMQITTGNAACAIAKRNAIFSVVPAALTKKILEKAKQVSIGKSMTLEQSRAKMLEYYQKIGVTEKQLLDYLSISKVDEVDTDMVVELRGLANALKEGSTTIQEAFAPKVDESKAAEVAAKFAGFETAPKEVEAKVVDGEIFKD